MSVDVHVTQTNEIQSVFLIYVICLRIFGHLANVIGQVTLLALANSLLVSLHITTLYMAFCFTK